MNLDGITALVTGGGSGLGEATARRLAKSGARVAILERHGTRTTELLDALRYQF